MSKKIAILFSGGLDSTYLVWKNLKDGNIVTPVYIEIENNRDKTILEKNRIELLWKEFEKEFRKPDENINEFNLKPICYAVQLNVNTCGGNLYFKQIPIWIFSVVFLQDIDVNEIQIGFVSNDDTIPYLEDIQNMYKSYQSICNELKPLIFPIAKMKKSVIAEELPMQYQKYVISCENPNIIGSKDDEIIEYEPCCDCCACMGVITNEYYRANGFSEIYEKAITKQHILALDRAGYKIFDKNGNNCAEQFKLFELKAEPYQLTINFNVDINKVLNG